MRRLADRRREIEQAMLARVYGIAEPPGNAELDYLHGLREAVAAAVDLGLKVLSGSDARPPRLPPVLLVQARLAARNGVALDVVLRRYFSGYTLFTSFFLEEAQAEPTSGQEESTERLHRNAGQFDRLVAAVARPRGGTVEDRNRDEGPPMAVGHPAKGLLGWRLSHRQARAVYPVVQHGGEVVAAAEAGLLAAVAKDETLVASLHQLYIEPLGDGEGLKETLHAYLAAGRNISSAASALQVNRQTVRTRLRAAEGKIGRSMDECGAEVEIALRLERELSTHTDATFLPGASQ